VYDQFELANSEGGKEAQMKRSLELGENLKMFTP
jgi:hypothetical protein